MDTTYWGNNFGVMVFMDALTKEVLLKYYIKSETNYSYIKGIKELQTNGFSILAIVCDGRRGLLHSFSDILVQMCQFHQAAIIRRYLTKRPRMLAKKGTPIESPLSDFFISFKLSLIGCSPAEPINSKIVIDNNQFSGILFLLIFDKKKNKIYRAKIIVASL